MGVVVRINTHSAGTVVEDNKIRNKQCFEELQKETLQYMSIILDSSCEHVEMCSICSTHVGASTIDHCGRRCHNYILL